LKAAHDEALKSLERDLAAQKEISVNSESKIESLKLEIGTLKTALEEAEAAAKERAAHQEQTLKRREDELKGVGQVIENLQNELQKQHESKLEFEAKLAALHQEHNGVISSLKEEHESTLKTLRDEHAAILGKSSSELEALEAAKAKEDSEFQERIDSTRKEYDQKLAELVATRTELEETIDKMRATSATDIHILKEKLDESAEALKDMEKKYLQQINEVQEEASKAIGGLDTKIETLETQVLMEKKAKEEAEKAIDEAKIEIEGLKKVLETLGEEDKDKEERHGAALAKMRTELDTAIHSLEDKKKEISLLEDKHRSALKSLGDDHAAEIEAREVAMLARIEEESKKGHTEVIEALKSEHSKALEAANEEHKNRLAKTEELHKKTLEEVLREHESQREDWEIASKQKRSEVEQAHVAAIAELQAELAKERGTLAKAEQELAEVRSVNSAAVEKLEVQLKELKGEWENEKAAAAAAHEQLKSAQKANADASALAKEQADQIRELRDTITDLRADLERSETAWKEKLSQGISELHIEHAASVAALKAETSTREAAQAEQADLKARLEKALEEAQTHKEKHEKTLEEVALHKSNAVKAEETHAQDYKDLNQIMSDEIDDLQKKLKEAKESADKQVKESRVVIEELRSNVERLTAELKIRDAELNEARAKSGGEGKSGVVKSKSAEEEGEGNGVSFAGTVSKPFSFYIMMGPLLRPLRIARRLIKYLGRS
jgi:hypothetical protein